MFKDAWEALKERKPSTSILLYIFGAVKSPSILSVVDMYASPKTCKLYYGSMFIPNLDVLSPILTLLLEWYWSHNLLPPLVLAL